MKYLLLVVALGVAVALAAVYVPRSDGQPALSAERLEQLRQDPGALRLQASEDARTLYRWRGDGGGWEYGHAPPSGVDAEPVILRDGGVIPAEELRAGARLPALTRE